MAVRDLMQEAIEMGVGGTAFRAAWEIVVRTGALRLLPNAVHSPRLPRANVGWSRLLPFYDPATVVDCMRERLSQKALTTLRTCAEAAAHGNILSFNRELVPFGEPIDWHLQPTTRRRWPAHAPWWQSLTPHPSMGDIKLTWEVARFPQAFIMARAAAFFPDSAPGMAAALSRQIVGFLADNPMARGIHWGSGQEIAVRTMAWLFALDTLLARSALAAEVEPLIAAHMADSALHIERYISYARLSVYNNHLLGEALALYLVGVLLSDLPQATRWRRLGWKLLVEATERQFNNEGAYIQTSHTYHRVALQYLVWATHIARVAGEHALPWQPAIERSIDFLVAQQNPRDGWMPNYGSNDGAMPSLWSTCAYEDFRPVLQLASCMVRGERLFEPGPWDEGVAWNLGPKALAMPLCAPKRHSVSFRRSGHHIVRGAEPGNFAVMYCGDVAERFGQIDMLHADVWWNGHNVLVDAGTYLYNGPRGWHEHFCSTSSHNTVAVDDRDQMLRLRRFKNVYLTRARLLQWTDTPGWAQVTGEHDGYRRHPGGIVHRRSLLFVKDAAVIVFDTLTGAGEHLARLHWLGGPYPYTPGHNAMSLDTPAGPFYVGVYDAQAEPLACSIVAGQESPPRGWLSRRYTGKEPVPSLAAVQRARVPISFLSILAPRTPRLARVDDAYELTTETHHIRFAVRAGVLRALEITACV